MKAYPIIFTALAGIFMASCGSTGNDSVSAADSANEAKADTAQEQPAAAPVAAAEEDSKFAVDAANGGMTEVALGKLAQEKATDPKVKEFAAMMVADHSKANDELKALAGRKNITLPATPGEDMQKTIADLSAKSGKDFDKAYVDEMVKGHDKTVKLFEDAQQNVKDADIRQFIDNTLPVLKAHQEHIHALKKAK